MRTTWCRALVGLLLLGACSDGGEPEEAAPTTQATADPPTTTTSSTSTTTAAPADPFAVPADPADIDEAYVERVLQEHNRVIGDAIRISLEAGPSAEIVARYNAVYTEAVSNLLLSELFGRTPEQRAAFRDPPGDPNVAVNEVLDATSECVAAAITQSAADLLVEPPPPFDGTLVLRRTASGDASELNQTHWRSEGVSDVVNGEPLCGG